MLAMTREETAAYARDGYILRSGLLSREEVGRFRDTARAQLERENREGAVMSKGDKDGKTTLLKMWTKAEDDQYGLLARDERLVDLAEDAVGKPIYLYSHKMTMKQPQEGGAWEWHQDFGYWYNYGCLAPEMMSIYVALDKSTKENGCLQLLKGSHKLGRLNHIRENDQTNVEQEHLEAALKRFSHEYAEMEAGDALVFDGNLLASLRRQSFRHLSLGLYLLLQCGRERALQAGARIWQLRAAAEGARRLVPEEESGAGLIEGAPAAGRRQDRDVSRRLKSGVNAYGRCGSERRARSNPRVVQPVAAPVGARGGGLFGPPRCYACSSLSRPTAFSPR